MVPRVEAWVLEDSHSQECEKKRRQGGLDIIFTAPNTQTNRTGEKSIWFSFCAFTTHAQIHRISCVRNRMESNTSLKWGVWSAGLLVLNQSGAFMYNLLKSRERCSWFRVATGLLITHSESNLSPGSTPGAFTALLVCSKEDGKALYSLFTKELPDSQGPWISRFYQ